jgi:hypothetical protein
MTFKVSYSNVPYKVASKKEWEVDTNKFWDKLLVSLDRDYASLEKRS